MEAFIKIVSGLLLILGLGLLLSLPVMWLWNYVMPDVFGLNEITFFQSVAINVLSGLLFQKSSSSNKE